MRPKQSRPSPISILRGHQHGLSSATFFTATTLLTGDEGGTLRVWDTRAEECVVTHRESHRSPLQSVLKEEGTDVGAVLCYKSGSVARVDVEHEVSRGELEGWEVGTWPTTGTWFTESFCAAAFVGKGILAGGGLDGVVILRDLRSGDEVGRLHSVEKGGMAMCVAAMGEGKCVVGYEDGGVMIWDVGMRRAIGRVRAGKDTILCVAGCERGGVAVAGAAVGGLVAVAEEEKGVEIMMEVAVEGEGVGCLVWDGKVIVSGEWDGRVRVWDGRRTRKLLERVVGLKWHEGSVGCLAVGGGLIASGGKDRTIALWTSKL